MTRALPWRTFVSCSATASSPSARSFVLLQTQGSPGSKAGFSRKFMTASKIVIDMTLLLPPELMAAIGPGRPRECTGGQGQSSGRAIAVHHLMGDLATLGKKPADEQL